MSLYNKIKNKEARIGVIGLGYVGLPLAVEFAKTGFNVTGIEVDNKKIEAINNGDNYISDIDDSLFLDLVNKKRLQATNDTSIIAKLDAISICVPTPLSKVNEPDVSYIIDAVNAIKTYLHKNLLIILESTTYPGTTREVILSTMEESGLIVGEDYFLCFSPERIDPGNKNYTISNTPKIIGGITTECTAAGNLLYNQIVKDVVPVSSPETAEMVKLLENTFRSINIGLANEVAIMCEKLGIDVWEVIEAANTKPYGFMKFTPGPGLGGHCIPIDPFYLTWKAREYKANTRFIELAGEVNISMPEYVIQKIFLALNRIGKSVKNSKVILLGLAYKKNVDDHRESVTFKIMDLLSKNGAGVDYNDPHIPEIMSVREYKQFVGKKSVPLKNLNQYDLTVILTDHNTYDFESIVEESNMVVDTRNACSKIKSEKIIKA